MPATALESTAKGCVAAFLENDAVERRCARELVGVECKGYVYKGPPKGRARAASKAGKGSSSKGALEEPILDTRSVSQT